MNAVEIEEAISQLAGEPFDAGEFPFAFLEAFGNKPPTIKRLRKGASNSSDVHGGVLQRSNVHMATCMPGKVGETLALLRNSPKTGKAKAKFILATDGVDFEAEDLNSGEVIACAYPDFADHFGFFLTLAGISTVRQLKNNPIDIKATGRLNKLYLALIEENEAWASDARRKDLNQFVARLIFCFFAEDTGIFLGDNLFTRTIEQMSDRTNTHEIIGELFRAMDTKIEDRPQADLRPWADNFPYVNGGLFAGTKDIPHFSRIARSYLLRAGELDWQEINPDIFGSMIQAVADDEERGELGMHYTSFENIMKVLGPLFLDDLKVQLEAAGDNRRKLLNLRRRLAAIRVFDPACGSGNFLVIAYKQMREIEHEIVERLRKSNQKWDHEPESWIALTSFYGIEIKNFAAEIARLALLIAEFQCDVVYIGQREAFQNVLPLKKTGQIVTGNALHLDWLEVCPPVEAGSVEEHDLAGPTGRLNLEGGEVEVETYICGNPPYKGSKWQTKKQKNDLKGVFASRTKSWKSLDYVAGWFMQAAIYGTKTNAASAFVSTNSICQGVQVPILWPQIFAAGFEIFFAHTSFKWANLASHNAGVTVVIVGISNHSKSTHCLFSVGDGDSVINKEAECINAYLVSGKNVDIRPSKTSISGNAYMALGNMPKDGGNLLMSADEAELAETQEPTIGKFIYDFVGSQEYVKGIIRCCLWIEDDEVDEALTSRFIRERLAGVQKMRLDSDAESTRAFADRPHRFKQIQGRGLKSTIVVPKVTSETRPYLPVGLLSQFSIVSDNAFALYDAPLWNMALIASRLHLVWIATVCGKMKTDFRYSNTLGWNTFPVPTLTQNQKDALTRCAEDILLAREAHFPATIADLYKPDQMPEDLARAHARNDETLERIYMGRCFKNDTERLEKLFEMYTKMTKKKDAAK